MNCSILLVTLNEVRNIESCIRSAGFSDDAIAFDSQSTDATRSIAEQAGARVFEQCFANFGAQREAASRLIDYRHPWVFSLDADERPDPELAAEIQQVTARSWEFSGYRVRRKDLFLGQRIQRATLCLTWHLRLYQREKVEHGALSVHEHPDVRGHVGELRGHILHDSFGKGITQ